MYLPENAKLCISLLEGAGYPCYAVGGCVRDAVLGLAPHDYDLCTAATPDIISKIFQDYPQIHAGEKHGTVGIIFPGSEVYEITTFRTDGSYTDSRHPDQVEFVTDVTRDLARRDFTVNAMAYSPTRGLADPFGGQADLQAKILRAVGDPQQRFSEDALRILRGVRFSVTYGLTVETATREAMFRLAHTMDKLARERVFDELCKLLLSIHADELVAFAPILTQVIPELTAALGFDQRSPYHIHDIYTHTAHVVEGVPPTLPLRWAALLHDIGKPATFTVDEKGIGHFYGHAALSAEMAEDILRRLKAPNDLRQQVVELIDIHMVQVAPTKKGVRKWLSRLGYDRFEEYLLLQQADLLGTGTRQPEDMAHLALLRQLAREIRAENACLTVKDLTINGHDLLALGYEGRQIGQALNALLEAVLEEQVENDKTALLAYLQTQPR